MVFSIDREGVEAILTAKERAKLNGGEGDAFYLDSEGIGQVTLTTTSGGGAENVKVTPLGKRVKIPR